MMELIDQIKIELFRTENKLATNYRIFNYSRKDLKIEISEHAFGTLKDQIITPITTKNKDATMFGVPVEVKKELKKDFIIYIDSSILN